MSPTAFDRWTIRVLRAAIAALDFEDGPARARAIAESVPVRPGLVVLPERPDR